MKFLASFFTLVLTLYCLSGFHQTDAWPILNPEVQQMAKVMMEVPQWHCLRYFKHDVHMMRRCRNNRTHQFRKQFD